MKDRTFHEYIEDFEEKIKELETYQLDELQLILSKELMKSHDFTRQIHE
ncbi:MAG: hypothetical protein ACFFKA_18890 [Candidatus Thorarchaeota archaeon]